MGREGFIKRIENSDEFKLLDKLVNQADASLEDAIQDVVNLSTIENPENPTDPHHGFSYVDYKVSLGLIELSQRLEPAKHRRLVEFVAELQTLTVIDPSTGEPFKTQGSTIWTDLPSLGYTELETWCEYGGDYKGRKSPSSASMYRHSSTPLTTIIQAPMNTKWNPSKKNDG